MNLTDRPSNLYSIGSIINRISKRKDMATQNEQVSNDSEDNKKGMFAVCITCIICSLDLSPSYLGLFYTKADAIRRLSAIRTQFETVATIHVV